MSLFQLHSRNLAPLKDIARVTPVDGARAVPAGGGSSPLLPGGSGKTPGRHDDRSATLSLDWDRWVRVTPALEPKSQEARSGPELRRWLAAASAAVERRQVSALRFSARRSRCCGS